MRIVRRRELADEVLHDAFLKIWQKSSTYQPSLGSARGWIYSVVRNQALNSVRDWRKEADGFDTPIEDQPDDMPGPLDILSRERETGALHHCLERLDEQKRACILLAYVDGYSQSQIAAQLACPLGTIKA